MDVSAERRLSLRVIRSSLPVRRTKGREGVRLTARSTLAVQNYSLSLVLLISLGFFDEIRNASSLSSTRDNALDDE